MADLLLVEWLGRGGIAQTSDAWVAAARAAGHEVRVVGRPGGIPAAEVTRGRRFPTPVGAVGLHAALSRAAADEIERWRPRTVYVQNYQVPFLETGVFEAARRVGTTSILALHNARPHSPLAGLDRGLGRLVALADEVVVHSHHVAEQVEHRFGRRAAIVQLPLPRELEEAAPRSVLPPDIVLAPRVALLFGVLRRGYKGAGLLRPLASALGPRWTVVAAGVGAARHGSGGVVTVDRFLAPGELRWLIEQATATLMPYRAASQSLVAVAAQRFGAPPVARAVGALPQQIEHGATGLLIPPHAAVDDWVGALRRIEEDPEWWRGVAQRGQEFVQEQGARAVAGFLALLR